MPLKNLNAWRVAGLLLFLPLGVACSPVRHTYLVPEELMTEAREDFKLDKVYASPRVGRLVGAVVLVDLADARESTGRRGRFPSRRDLETFGRDFEQVLSNQLWWTGIFGDVGHRREETPPPAPDVILNVAITEWNEGNALLRWAIGTWVGATRVQVEAMFVEVRSGDVLAAFADARTHPGLGPFSFSTFRPQTLIAIDLAGFAKALPEDLLELTGAPRPTGPYGRRLAPRPSRGPLPDETNASKATPGAPPNPT